MDTNLQPLRQRVLPVLRDEGIPGVMRKVSNRLSVEWLRLLLRWRGRRLAVPVPGAGDGPVDPAKVKLILVVSIRGIGDAILATPALQMIRSRFPQAEIVLFGTPRAEEIFGSSPGIVRKIMVSPRSLEFSDPAFYRALLEAQSLRPDLTFIFYPSLFPPLSWAAPLLGGPIFAVAREEVTDAVAPAWDPDAHTVEINAGLARAAGCEGPTPNPEMWLRPEEDAAARDWLDRQRPSRPFVIMHTGCTPGLQKFRVWPIGHTVKLAEEVHRRGADLAFLQGPDERESVAEIVGRLSFPCRVVGSELSFRETAALVRQADLLIANDSGWTHVAAAVGVRQIALFGPVPATMHPYGSADRIRVIESPATCAPCYTSGRKILCDAPHCMSDITVESVLPMLDEFLFTTR